MNYRVFFVLALSLALTAPPRASGQASTKLPPVFGADVNLVAIPVFVTDKDGKTVPGLTVSDFEVEDGGKPGKIQGFLSIEGDADSRVPEGSVAAAVTSRRQYLFLFDLGLSGAGNIERAKRAARAFLETSVGPRDLVGVASFGRSGLSSLLGFTSDRNQTARAIETLGFGDTGRRRDPLGIIFDMNLDSFLSDRLIAERRIDDKTVAMFRDQAMQISRSERQEYTKQVGQMIGGFASLGQALDSIQGRKQVIFFSEGFDTTVLAGARGEQKKNSAEAVAAGRLWEVDGEGYFGSAEGASAYNKLFDVLKASDVVVHTVDLHSLSGEDGSLIAQQDMGSPSSGIDSLVEMAKNTGGRFIRAANDVGAALREISDSTRNYYVLAFSPLSAEVGKARKLKVKVLKPGLSVSHRPSYVLPDPKKPNPARMAMEGAELIVKGVTGGPIHISAFALPYRSREKGLSIPVVIHVPGSALAESVKRKQIGLEMFGYLIDAKGSVRDFFSATPTLDPALLGDRLKKTGLQIITTFAAPEGASEVRILVRDPATATWGALRLPVSVPNFAATVISAPMATDDPFARVALPTTTERRPDRDIPFRIGDQPFTVETEPILKMGSSREFCVFKSPSNGEAAGLKVVLIGADGVEAPQTYEGLKVVRDADGFDRVVFKVAPRNAPAGDYTMRVSVGPTTSVTSPLRVQ